MNYWDMSYRQVIYDGTKFVKWHYWGFRSDAYFISPDRDQRQQTHFQRTGQKISDKYIWEGDIIRSKTSGHTYVVEWRHAISSFVIVSRTQGVVGIGMFPGTAFMNFDLIGNKMENSELLEG